MDGKALKAIRLDNELTQAEFAAKLRISVSAVSMMERGERSVTERVRHRVENTFVIDDRMRSVIRRFKENMDI